MSRDTVGPSFHEAVRRTFSIGTSKGHQNGNAQEDTPLLPGDRGDRSGPDRYRRRDQSETYQFFLNTRYTPGIDSDKLWVKVPAHIWHITKATLLSSRLPLLPLYRRAPGRPPG